VAAGEVAAGEVAAGASVTDPTEVLAPLPLPHAVAARPTTSAAHAAVRRVAVMSQ
jgi:hypothetical protein